MNMNDDKTPQIDHRRLTVLALCLTFGLAVLAAQLVRYQVIGHRDLKDVHDLMCEREREVLPQRGYIADAHGHLLAMNVFDWEITASPKQIADPNALAELLAGPLGLDRDKLYAKLASGDNWALVARSVPQEIGETIAGWGIAGLHCEPKSLRVYPMADLTAHVIGFVNNTNNGFYGVEGHYNLPLKGIPGSIIVETDGMGRELPRAPRVVRRAEAGTNLILTLDLNIQYMVQQELQRALRQFEAESGTVIVMDPKTGALLALVSLPSYDPNEYATTDPALLPDPSVSKLWEPGSVLKIITWGAGLDSGIITPDMTFYDEGRMVVGGRIIVNADRKAHGEVTMTEALAQSLNTIAAYISTTMGKDRFYTYLRRFGFGDLTGADLDSEGPGMMKLPGDKNWFPSELGTNSFGQGIAVTPMQMITAAAAVANGGRLMRPYIVKQRITGDERGQGSRIVQIEPKIERQAISMKAAETLTTMLTKTVEREATEARVPGYRIAGKTGTAQIPTAFGYHRKDTIVSFVGYAPADDPQFIVLIKLDKPRTSRWAAHTAAPAFKAIARRLLVYMQIPPDDVRLAVR